MNGPGPGPGEGPIDEGGAIAASRRPASPDDLLRRRAEQAEQRAADLEQQLAHLQAQLDDARRDAALADRRCEIERSCAQADAVDTPTVALLTELAVAQMDEPDIAAALADLRRTKPFLFRTAPRPPASSAMAPALDPSPAQALTELADRARATGDRRALLAYLRRRRHA